MNDYPEESLRKELIEDYFLEITDLIGSENLRTEIEFKDKTAYTATLKLNLSSLDNEQDLENFMLGLRSIVRRINILEKDVQIVLAIELQGMHRDP